MTQEEYSSIMILIDQERWLLRPKLMEYMKQVSIDEPVTVSGGETLMGKKLPDYPMDYEEPVF